MKPVLTKIDINDIKHMVCEVVNQLNELSSKDWHDKYLTNIPEDVFYTVMGRDKKKTPIKELMFKLYFKSLQWDDKPEEFLIKVANDYNNLNAQETQKVNALITKYGANNFVELDKIIKYVKYAKDTEISFDSSISIYDENCVKLYEDNDWLVLCPLTAEASRKCIAPNGNHWCTCSSSYKQYFPQYTYQANSCIIAFLCKKNESASFQCQFDRNGQEKQIYDYEDRSIDSEEVSFPQYRSLLDNLIKDGIISRLVIDTARRINANKNVLMLSPSQIVRVAANKLNELFETNQDYFRTNTTLKIDEEDIYIYRPSMIGLAEKPLYIYNLSYHSQTMITFMYDKKTGKAQLIYASNIEYCRFFDDNYLLGRDELASVYNPIVIGYVRGGDAIRLILFNHQTDEISIKTVMGYETPHVESSVIPLIRLGNKFFQVDGTCLPDNILEKTFILPKSWGGGKFDVKFNLNTLEHDFSVGEFSGNDYDFGNGFSSLYNPKDGSVALYSFKKPEPSAIFHNLQMRSTRANCFALINKEPILLNGKKYFIKVAAPFNHFTFCFSFLTGREANSDEWFKEQDALDFAKNVILPNIDYLSKVYIESDSFRRDVDDMIRMYEILLQAGADFGYFFDY